MTIEQSTEQLPVATPEAAPQAVDQKPPAQDEDLTKRLAILARRESEAREKELRFKKEFEEREKTWRQREEEYQRAMEKIDAIKRKDWSKIADEIDYNDLTEYRLSGNKMTPEAIIEQKTRELEAKFEQRLAERFEQMNNQASENAKALQERQKTQAKFEFKTKIQADLSSEAPQFEWLGTVEDAEDMVWSMIEENWNRQVEKGVEFPKALSFDEAAKIANDYIQEESIKRISSLKSKDKLLAALGLNKEEPVAPPQGQPMKPQSQEPKTLTNSISVPSGDKRQNYLDVEESKRNAAKLLQWR